IEPEIFRSYSIVGIENGILSLLIDTRVGGPASIFFDAAEMGTELHLIGVPMGKFVVHDTGKDKVFVATGTGVAPFVSMIKAVLGRDAGARVRLYFGARHIKEDFSVRLFEDIVGARAGTKGRFPNFSIIHCISRPEKEPGKGFLQGRVTEIVPKNEKDCREPEFYLCGNPKMVDDIQHVLRLCGADRNLFTEKYG
ncbi:hypothetical protein KKH03_00870, partial [Patescibacteria group bacterium]|nr:hypothetical protein [Patescibacteria group bacterium]